MVKFRFFTALIAVFGVFFVQPVSEHSTFLDEYEVLLCDVESREFEMKAPSVSVIETFPLDPLGCHGVCHWGRGFENERRLAADNGAGQQVINYFAALHDSQRFKNGSDPDHGLRAAKLATLFREQHLSCLSESHFALLQTACCLHNRQRSHPDLAVQTCVDADRLDHGRVGITPDPDRLCTDAAQKLLLWATQRGEERIVPMQTLQSWGLSDLVASLKK